MDSVTQIVLGAAVANEVLGKKLGNKAILYGAILGTIPDLDVVVGKFLDPLTATDIHRGFSHSTLFFLLFDDFELILMDIHMPDMNGYQTTAELRKLKPKAKTQIVALTASDTLEEREECIKNNMDGYLTKPIKEKDFLAIVSAK